MKIQKIIKYVKVYFRYRLLKPSIKIFDEDAEVIRFLKLCIADADVYASKLNIPCNRHVLNIEGMSSCKVRHLYNNICSIKKSDYLEIGVWNGSTFISANYKNKIKSVAIDNWSQFSGDIKIFHKNCRKYLGKKKYEAINIDCFNVDIDILPKINIFLYDGDHSFESHKKAFSYFNDRFNSTFIAIVDDYNCKDVQLATQEVFKELNYIVLFEKYLPSKFNGDTASWWNGIYVALIRKKQ